MFITNSHTSFHLWWIENLVKDKIVSKSYNHDLSCIIWENRTFFLKTWYFFFGQKMKDDLSQEIHGNIIFFVCTYRCYKRDATPICQKKNQKSSDTTKLHLGVIDILDWHTRESSNNSLYFYGDHYKRFHILLSSQKKQET